MVVAMPRCIGARCGLNWTTTWLAGGHAELLLDLGDMPVTGDAVGLDRAVALREQERHVGLLAGAGDAAVGVDDQATRLGLEQAGAQQRYQRHLDAGRVAARAGDELRGLPRVVGLEFRDDVTGLRGERRRRMVMAVILFVEREVAETEVGGQVEHPLAGGDERRGVLGGDAVRERQEPDDPRRTSRIPRERIAEKTRAASTMPRRRGISSATDLPAKVREQTAASRTRGWRARTRTSSSPV